MKTQAAAIKTLRYMLGDVAPGYVYQTSPNGSWSWASMGSPVGQVCKKALSESSGKGIVCTSSGEPIYEVSNVQLVPLAL